MWYHKLSEILEKHQFRKSIHDEALFINNQLPDKPVWCFVYVDDILMTSPSSEHLHKTVEALKKDLTLANSESLTQYLVMNLWKTDDGEICLSAEKCAKKLEKKFQLSFEGRKIDTPLPTAELGGMQPVIAMNKFPYLSKTGSLLFARTCCRPDI